MFASYAGRSIVATEEFTIYTEVVPVYASVFVCEQTNTEVFATDAILTTSSSSTT